MSFYYSSSKELLGQCIRLQGTGSPLLRLPNRVPMISKCKQTSYKIMREIYGTKDRRSSLVISYFSTSTTYWQPSLIAIHNAFHTHSQATLSRRTPQNPHLTRDRPDLGSNRQQDVLHIPPSPLCMQIESSHTAQRPWPPFKALGRSHRRGS